MSLQCEVRLTVDSSCFPVSVPPLDLLFFPRRYTAFDLHVSGNSRVDGAYRVVEKVITPPDEAAGAAKENQVVEDNTVASLGAALAGAPTPTDANAQKKPESKKILRKTWYAHRSRKIVLTYRPDQQRWEFLERRPIGAAMAANAPISSDPEVAALMATLSAPPTPGDALSVSVQDASVAAGTGANGAPPSVDANGNPTPAKPKYGPPQLICYCVSAIIQPELLVDALWLDPEGNKFEPQITITPKQVPLSK